MKKIKYILVLLLTLFPILSETVTFAYSPSREDKTILIQSYEDFSIDTVLKNKKNILITNLDSQNRPSLSSFIGSDKYQVGKRVGSPSEPYNIKSWKNQKISYDNKEKYLWDRGHLIGNQFAGLPSNIPENIVGETFYTNQILQLYFEGGRSSSNPNALDNWLYLHKNYFIEYHVQANYKSQEDNYPSSVTLRYRGLDKNGNPIKIKLPDLDLEGAGKQLDLENEFTSVTLQNIVPGYIIDYKTGRSSVGQIDPVEQEEVEEPSYSNKEKTELSIVKDAQDAINKVEEVKKEVEDESTFLGRLIKFFIESLKSFLGQ